jgi:tetratricopeptide (TPR) repeat protein
MQDSIVSRLANTLDAELVEAEARRAERSQNPDAIDLVLQGRSSWNRGVMTLQRMLQTRAYYERALALDPDNVEALVGTAGVDVAITSTFMTGDRDVRIAAAESALATVLSISPRHARAHMFLSALQVATDRAALAIGESEQALALNRNLAEAHSILGFAKLCVGRGQETEAHVQEALRLSPRDNHAFRWMHIIGAAKLVIGSDAEAISWLRRSLEANRNFPIAHFQLAAALALHGSLQEAKGVARAGLALDPTFTVRSRFRGVVVSSDPTFRAGSKRIVEGMLLAGVPEG